MPTKYSPTQKEEALEMLRAGSDISLVHFNTGIPERTLRDWRKQLAEELNRQTAEKTFSPAAANWQSESESPQPNPAAADEDSAAANPDFEDFTYIREKLMKYARHMAANLQPDEPDSGRHTLALSRVLDRIQRLDQILPDSSPEQVIRFEFVYDGVVHALPPWARADENPDPSFLDAEHCDILGRAPLDDLPLYPEDDHAPADSDTTDRDE